MVKNGNIWSQGVQIRDYEAAVLPKDPKTSQASVFQELYISTKPTALPHNQAN